MTGDAKSEAHAQPVFSVTRGEATPEDIAGLIAIFAAHAGASPVNEYPETVNAWSNKERMFRHFPTPGPGAWRASGLAQ